MSRDAAVEIINRALNDGRKTLSEFESKQVLAAYRIPVTREILLRERGDVPAAAQAMGYPLVMKWCSPQVAHKTDLKVLLRLT